MSDWKPYRKKGVQLMRPYVPGEDLRHISVSDADLREVACSQGNGQETGGMIAKSSTDPDDQWYVSAKFFAENYEVAS